jgi:hypothetical protein
VSSDVKNQEPWTTWVEEVWKVYQSNGFSSDSSQPRHPSIPEETTQHNPDDGFLPCSGSEQEREIFTRQSPPRMTNHEPAAAPTPITTSTTPPSDQYDTGYLLTHRNQSHVQHERNSPTSREEDTSTFSETQQKCQRVQEEMTTPNTDVVKNIIRDIHAGITRNPGEHTKAVYVEIDEIENVSTPTEDTTFKLSDTKQLELFYIARLKIIPLKMLMPIVCLWYKEATIAVPDQTYRENREGEFHKTATFMIHSQSLGIVSMAAEFLLEHGWIECLQEKTKAMIENASENSFSELSKERARDTILPSLFYVERLHKLLCRLKHVDGQSKSDVIIEWQRVHESKGKERKRKNEINMVDIGQNPPKRFAQQKHQPVHCVGEVTSPQYPGAVHKPIDSRTPLPTAATYCSLQVPLGVQQPQIPGWQLMEQIIPSYPCPAATYQGVDSTVPSSFSFTNATSYLQPYCPSGFDLDRCECNTCFSDPGMGAWSHNVSAASTQSALGNHRVPNLNYEVSPVSTVYKTPSSYDLL